MSTLKHGRRHQQLAEPSQTLKSLILRAFRTEAEATAKLTAQFLADTWHLLLCMLTIWLAHHAYTFMFSADTEVGSIKLVTAVDTGHIFALSRWLLRNLKLVFR